ncbi:MAG: LuxR C-terminal-related transcriptional regulator [Nitrospirota bacterium]
MPKIKPLTPRERQVLQRVARGLSNREVGERLGISVRTAEVHRFNIMRKLRTRNVAQLLRAALKRRLVTIKDLLPPIKRRRRS